MAKGIIFIHGMGDQKQGEEFVQVVNPIADYIEENTSHKVERNFRLGNKNQASEIRLNITPKTGNTTEWIFREVWWAESFQPPTLTSMLGWCWSQGFRQLKAIKRGISEEKDEVRGFQRGPSFLQKIIECSRHVGYWFIAFGLQLLPIIAVLALIILVPIIILAPILRLIPKGGGAVDTLYGWVERLLVGSWGDTKRYINHGIWAANMRRVFEDELKDMRQMLKSKEIDDITIIAHSWGSVIAYEVLISENVKEVLISENINRGKIKLVTVGSGLNHMSEMVKLTSPAHAKHRFYNSMSRNIDWLNIYSKYDTTACGKLRSKNFFIIRKDFPKQEKILNFDSPFSDHMVYWVNSAFFLPLLLKKIEGSNWILPNKKKLEHEKDQWKKRVYKANALRLFVFFFPAVASLLFAFSWHEPNIWIIHRIKSWFDSWLVFQDQIGEVTNFLVTLPPLPHIVGWFIWAIIFIGGAFLVYSLIWNMLRPDYLRNK